MSTTAAKRKATARSRPAGVPSAKGSRSSAAKSKVRVPAAKSQPASPKAANKNSGGRLSPGQLNDLVLGYMKKHKRQLPTTAGMVARGIKRSSGAVANCLERLERAGKVKLANKKPREYDLAGSTK